MRPRRTVTPLLCVALLAAACAAPPDTICPGLAECRFADPCADAARLQRDQGAFAGVPLLGVAVVEACRGDKAAALLLGESFETGQGVPEDQELASRWYRLAAVDIILASSAISTGPTASATLPGTAAGRAGFPEASYRLGVMHVEGRGVPQDLEAARYWLRRAAQTGHPRADLVLAALPKS